MLQLFRCRIAGDVFIVKPDCLTRVAHLSFAEAELEFGKVGTGILGLDRRLDSFRNFVRSNAGGERILGIVPSLLREQSDSVVKVESPSLSTVILEQSFHTTGKIEHLFEGFRSLFILPTHTELTSLLVKSF